MALHPGEYLIHNVGTKAPIQRSDAKDGDLISKKVVSVPPGSKPFPWLIEKGVRNETDVYTLKADSAPAYADLEKHLVFVSLAKDILGKQFEWKITPHPDIGEDVYTIETTDTSPVGWVLEKDAPFTQVSANPLQVGPGLVNPPLHYPPPECWTIVPYIEIGLDDN